MPKGKSRINIINLSVKHTFSNLSRRYHSDNSLPRIDFIIDIEYIYRRETHHYNNWVISFKYELTPSTRLYTISGAPYHSFIEDVLSQIRDHLLELKEENNTEVGKILNGDTSNNQVLIEAFNQTIRNKIEALNERELKAKTAKEALTKAFEEGKIEVVNRELIFDKNLEDVIEITNRI
jgi:hypothetical protein